MSVDNSELIAFQQSLEKLIKDVPTVMNKLTVDEGRYARDQARKICKEEHIVNTGDYRRSWDSGKKALRVGNSYKIDVFNNLDYAKHLEYGFRSHFVPGHWDGSTFVYQPGDPLGGMYVGKPGSFVRGHFTMKRAIKRTRVSQDARLKRKIEKVIKESLEQ